MFVVVTYKNKPAILDTKANVYYFGYKSYTEANKRANELNKGL